jgi:curved DNA-binding protein
MKFEDFYKVLGVARNASKEDIQRAYRKLARKYHPDVNKAPGAEEKFKQVNEAANVLKDPEKRKLYDTYGEQWQAAAQGGFQEESGFRGFRQQGGPGNDNFNTTYQNFDEEDLNDFFGNLFGGGFGGNEQFGRRNYSPPSDSSAELGISLTEAYHGGRKKVSLQTYEQSTDGKLHRVTRNLEITIPKGIQDGATLRLAGQGGSGSGKKGDLLLKIRIQPDPRFSLVGHDLLTVVPISPWEAALGVKVQVETLSGRVMLRVPKGSQNGQSLRLRGKGMAKKGGGHGDLLAILEVRLPQKISAEEEKLLQEIARISRFDPRSERKQKAPATSPA